MIDIIVYINRDTFRSDFMYIVNNCRTYNLPSTTYYRCADTIERAFNDLMDKLDM
jgi:hypothetical protein